jgi:hypothetical protein
MGSGQTWFGFEGEDHEGGLHAEYAVVDEQIELSPEDEKEHAEYVSRVAAEYGFPLSDWTPTIPSRDLT